jgi:hypothetical protein
VTANIRRVIAPARAAIGRFLAGPAWSIWGYLAIAACLRLPAAWCAHGFDYVDEQYQYVDPAWHLATGGAWHRTWEWLDGIRSWIYPGLLAGILRALQFLGCEDAVATMRAVRGVHALVSLLPLAAFWCVVVRWRPLRAPRLPLLLFAASGLLVDGVTPSGPSLAATLATTAGLCLAGPTSAAALGGLCLGFAFCMRFQDALFGPPFLAVLLWQRRWAAGAAFAAACLPGIGAQALADWCADGSLLGTPVRCVRGNVGEGAAQKWQQYGPWFYVVAGLVPLLVLLPGMLRNALARLAAGAAALPGAVVGAGVHIAVHSCIARKALRFERPAFALLFAAVLVGLHVRDGARARWHTLGLVVVHAALWLYASFWFGNAGAVRTALWLDAEPTFDGRVAVVGSDASALGGAFYLRPPRMAAVAAPRDGLWPWLAERRADVGEFVVAVREPLPPAEVAAAGWELAASFTGHLDLRRGERRFVYRRRP